MLSSLRKPLEFACEFKVYLGQNKAPGRYRAPRTKPARSMTDKNWPKPLTAPRADRTSPPPPAGPPRPARRRASAEATPNPLANLWKYGK